MSTPWVFRRDYGLRWLSALYVGLLAYGTLYPLRGWHVPATALADLFIRSLTAHASRADLLTNVLVYIPYGLLVGLGLYTARRYLPRFCLIVASGLLLSLGLESLQALVPGRTPSLLDIGLNTLGTALGAGLPPLLSEQSRLGRYLADHRRRWFVARPTTELGLAVLILWVLGQLSPLVPSIDLGNLREGLAPLRLAWQDLARIDLGQMVAYALAILALGLIARDLWRGRLLSFVPVFLLFILTVLALKVPIVTRQLSLEALFGASIGWLLTLGLAPLRERWRLFLTAAVLALAHAAEQLRPVLDPQAGLHPFAWTLFEAQTLSLSGLTDILSAAWPFVAAVYLWRRLQPHTQRPGILLASLVVLTYSFALEWLQQYIPGRYGEITDVLVGGIAWGAAWLAGGGAWRTRVLASAR